MSTLSIEDRPLIVTPKDLRERVSYWRDLEAHIIAPGSGSTSFIGPSHAVAETVMHVDPSQSAGMVYQDLTLMAEGQYAFSRLALQLISFDAGISWLDTCECTSDPTVPLFWRFRADGDVRSFSGQWLKINGTSEVNLQDRSPQIGGWSPARWKYLVGKNEALVNDGKARRDDLVWTINGWDERLVQRTRRFGARLAETKAKNAAIRGLGLKSSYTLDELEQPFVIFQVVYVPDMSVERIRDDVHARAMRSRADLYPQRAEVGQ